MAGSFDELVEEIIDTMDGKLFPFDMNIAQAGQPVQQLRNFFGGQVPRGLEYTDDPTAGGALVNTTITNGTSSATQTVASTANMRPGMALRFGTGGAGAYALVGAITSSTTVALDTIVNTTTGQEVTGVVPEAGDFIWMNNPERVAYANAARVYLWKNNVAGDHTYRVSFNIVDVRSAATPNPPERHLCLWYRPTCVLLPVAVVIPVEPFFRFLGGERGGGS